MVHCVVFPPHSSRVSGSNPELRLLFASLQLVRNLILKERLILPNAPLTALMTCYSSVMFLHCKVQYVMFYTVNCKVYCNVWTSVLCVDWEAMPGSAWWEKKQTALASAGSFTQNSRMNLKFSELSGCGFLLLPDTTRRPMRALTQGENSLHSPC